MKSQGFVKKNLQSRVSLAKIMDKQNRRLLVRDKPEEDEWIVGNS